jgi:membrane protein
MVNLRTRLESLLWHRRVEALPPPAALLVRIARYVYCVLRDVSAGQLTLQAMGLVYVTILSLVPLLAISLSVLKSFGFQRQIAPLLTQFLLPLGADGADIAAAILRFVDNAQSDILAGIGLIVLFMTAVSMADQVESGFNRIWRVERPRGLGRRISGFLTVILVGPVVMITAMTLIARLESSALIREFSDMAVGSASQPFSGLVPYVLVCAAFTFVYWFVPNTRVQRRAALVGGLAGGGLWALTGAVFAAFVVNSTLTMSIYAAFAVAVSALIWLYLCWLILLIGAQVAFYAQNPDYMRVGYREHVTGTSHQEQIALAIMQIVASRFRHGSGPAAIADITAATSLTGLALAPVMNRLEGAGLLARTADERLLPGRDPARLLLRDIVGAVRHPPGADIRDEARWPEAVATLRDRIEGGVDGALGEQSLADLLRDAARR